MSVSVVPHCVGPLDVNCYLVGCDVHHRCAVVDPGDTGKEILALAAARGWEVSVIVNTHTHADHTGANSTVKEATGAPLVMHADDAAMAADPAMKDMADYLGLRVSP
ncbi:MAG: MBL fold metallo-hydrolase, partial [Nitrospinae bacterium]|nr:MBL fold metallo-hydrolase [Nitrospinota bacterium]